MIKKRSAVNHEKYRSPGIACGHTEDDKVYFVFGGINTDADGCADAQTTVSVWESILILMVVTMLKLDFHF